MYRDEEPALRARMDELEQRVEDQNENLATMEWTLGEQGWIRSSEVRSPLPVVLMIVLSGFVAVVLTHLYVFEPKTMERIGLDEERAKVDARAARLTPALRELLGRSMGLERQVKQAKSRWTAMVRLGSGFLELDPLKPDEAHVLMGAWACHRSGPAVPPKAREAMTARLREQLDTLCRDRTSP